MQEFNHRRAWDEWASPKYQEIHLKPGVASLLGAAAEAAKTVSQNRNGALPWPQDPAVKQAFDAMNPALLREVAGVVYYFGHFHPMMGTDLPSIQNNGLYWKFQMWADASLIGRDEEPSASWMKTNFHTDAFMDHKEGTEFDSTELSIKYRNAFAGVLDVKCDNVNHRVVLYDGSVDRTYKPHPFVIGLRHFEETDGAYLNPRSAPCAYCKSAFEDHKSDRVLLLSLLRDATKTEIQDLIQTFAEQMKEDKIDGVAFVKSSYSFKE